MIRVVVDVRVKKGMKENFLFAAKNLIKESRKEKGCLEYNLVDSTEEDKLYFIEKWETMEDLKNHSQAPHSKKYAPILNEFRFQPSKVEIYEIIE